MVPNRDVGDTLHVERRLTPPDHCLPGHQNRLPTFYRSIANEGGHVRGLEPELRAQKPAFEIHLQAIALKWIGLETVGVFTLGTNNDVAIMNRVPRNMGKRRLAPCALRRAVKIERQSIEEL